MRPEKAQYYPLSFSSLKAFSVSPLSFIYYKARQVQTTAAMQFGTLVHRYVLEPTRWADSVVVYDGRRDMRTKAYREFCEEHEGKDILTQSEVDRVRYAGTRCLAHPLAAEVLNNCNRFEMHIEYERSGIPHRGYIDACGPAVMCDLKTTKSIAPHSMQRTVWESKYYMQSAMYLAGLAAHTGTVIDEYYIIGIENTEPFNCGVFRIDERLIQRGAVEWDNLLEEFEEWDGSVQHPGYLNPVPTLITEPSWAPAIDSPWM
jgi:hypothetical protein